MDELDFAAVLEDAMSGPAEAIAGSLDGIAEAAAAAGEELSAALEEAMAPVEELSVAIDDLSAQVQLLVASLVENSATVDENTGALSANTAALDENAGSADAAAGAHDAAGESSNKLSGALGLMGVAALAAGAATIFMGGKTEDALTQIAALTGASQPQMQQYTQGLKDMSQELGVSMTDAANGLYYVISAGFTGSDAMGVLKVAMEGAKAGGADMQTVADALTSSLNAYGASASDASHYSDIMVEAVTQGKQTFADFAGAVGMAAVTGHTAGFSFDEVAAAEATMTQSGLNAHRAVMQLDFLMRSIGLSTDAVADKAKKLGIEGFDKVAFSSDTLIQKLQYLQQISDGNKQTFEKLVGGANGLSAAELLLGKNGDTYNGILDKMKHSAGATQTAFETSEASMSAHAGHLAGSFSVLAYNIQQMAAPYVNAAMDHLTGAFSGFANFVENHGPEAKAIFAGLAVVIGTVMVAAMQPFIASMWAAATAEGAMTLPILAIGVALAALVTGFLLAYQHIGPFHDAVDRVRFILTHIPETLTAIRDHVLEAFSIAKATVEGALTDIQQTLAGFVSGAEALWNNIKTPVLVVAGILATVFGPALIQSGVQAVTAGAQIAGSFVASLWDSVTALGATAAEAVGDAATGIAGFATSAAGAAVTFFTEFIPSVVAAGASMLSMAVGAIVDAVTGLGAYAVAGWAAAAATIAATWPILAIIAAIAALVGIIILVVTHWKQITDFLGGVWAAVVAAVQAGWQKLGQIIQDVVTFIRNLIVGYFNLYRTIIQDAINFIVGLFKWLFDHNYYFHDLVEGIIAVFNWLKDTATTIWNDITSFLVNLWNRIVTLAKAAWQLVVAAIMLEVHGLQNLLQAAWNVITGAITFVWNTVKAFLQLVWRGIQLDAQTAWNLFHDYVIAPVLAVWNWLTDRFNQLKAWLSNMWSAIQQDVARGWALFLSAVQAGATGVMNWVQNTFIAPLLHMLDLGQALYNAALNAIKMFAKGLGDAAGGVFKQAQNIAGGIAKFLGFHSPTEEGPGADADKWMPNLGTMMVRGLLDATPGITTAARSVAGALQGQLGTLGGAPGSTGLLSPGALSAYGNSSGLGGNLTIQVQMPNSFQAGFSLLDPSIRAQLADELAQAMYQKLGLQGRLPTAAYAGHK